MAAVRTIADQVTLIYDSAAGITGIKDVMSGPCTLLSARMTETNAAAAYLKLYDAVNPTIGSDAVDYEFQSNASETRFFNFAPSGGLEFVNGFSYMGDTVNGDGTTATPTGFQVTFEFKTK